MLEDDSSERWMKPKTKQKMKEDLRILFELLWNHSPCPRQVRGNFSLELHIAQDEDEKAIHKISLCTIVCPLCGEG